MQASSVCPSCHGLEPPNSEVCPGCGRSANANSALALPPERLAELRSKAEREWSLAGKAFPRIRLRFETFLLKVSNIIRKQLPIESASASSVKDVQDLLENLRWQELFLATACAGGDEAAWEIFRTQYQSVIRKTALRALGNTADAQELADTLLTDLFLPSTPGSSKGDNKIGQYHGMGSLEGWIKVVIHRLAIDRFRIQQKNVSLEDLAVEPASTEPARQTSHSIEHFEMQKALAMVSGSLTAALAQLSTQEKLVLNLYYLQNVNLKEIGKWLKVHESTVSRLLERLKAQLRKAVNKRLQDEFKIKKVEIPHIIELAHSHLEIDLRTILSD
jgi:RNA polymerase sigma-70 factor